MKARFDLIEELSKPTVSFDGPGYNNIPEEFIRLDPHEGLDFNGYSNFEAYGSNLEQLYKSYKDWKMKAILDLKIPQLQLDELTSTITSFTLILQEFYTITNVDMSQDLNLAYRDDLIFLFDQDPGEDVTPNLVLYRWLSPFLYIQKGFAERVLHFFKHQKGEVLRGITGLELTPGSVIEPDPDFALPTKPNKPKINRLDIRQSALLFFLIKKQGAIRDLSNGYFATLIHHLTGYSEHNLRTNDGLGAIWDICQNKKVHNDFKDIPNHNLIEVKKLLNETISDIDMRIQKNSA